MCAAAGPLVSPRPTRRIMPLSALLPPPVAGPSPARNGFLAPSFKLRTPCGLNPLDDPYRRQALSFGLCSNSLDEREGPHRSSFLPPLESQVPYLHLVAHSFAPLKSATSFISASYALFHENYRGRGTPMISLEKADPSKGKALPGPGTLIGRGAFLLHTQGQASQWSSLNSSGGAASAQISRPGRISSSTCLCGRPGVTLSRGGTAWLLNLSSLRPLI